VWARRALNRQKRRFLAPPGSIWTTIHNMGGNDGMKGDMRMLQEPPGGDASHFGTKNGSNDSKITA
jgi:hypothetical protein